jgi:hypothetical protein
MYFSALYPTVMEYYYISIRYYITNVLVNVFYNST